MLRSPFLVEIVDPLSPPDPTNATKFEVFLSHTNKCHTDLALGY